MTPEDRQQLIAYRKKRYLETLVEVETLIAQNCFHAAITRMYYGMYYLVSILALFDNFSTSKHAQLIGWFNRNYITTKMIDVRIGKFFHRSYEKRSKSDYADFIEFTLEEVEQYFLDMKEFSHVLLDIIAQKE